APLGVAFSGGVDSSVLLALAARTLGPDQVVAILGVSPSLGTDDRQTATQGRRIYRCALPRCKPAKGKLRRIASMDRIVAIIARPSRSLASLSSSAFSCAQHSRAGGRTGHPRSSPTG